MSRNFFSTSNAERKRQKRAAEREEMLAAAIKSSEDDTSDAEMDITIPKTLLINDQSASCNTFQIDNLAAQQSDNAVSSSSSSADAVNDDDDDLDELFHAADMNYQRKIYTNSFLSICDACEIIIKLSRRLNLDKSKTTILLNGIRSLLPSDNNLPRTIVGLMKILGGFNNNKKVIYYCTECLTHLTTPQQTICLPNCALNNKYRPFSNLITFDLPALALNCNVAQYNGYYTCPFCTIPGVSIDKQVFYPYSPNPYPRKIVDDYRRHGVSNSASITTFGNKGATPLTHILLFPSQISIDYMHLSCSGHMKTLIGYWHKMLLPHVFLEVSNYLTSVALPHHFKYQFMPLVDYNTWKTKFFSRYRRGFKTFHSKAYSRDGKAISYQVSLTNSKCIQARKKCFVEVLFYFKLFNVNYAFVKKYSCINFSLAAGLTTVIIPQNILKRFDSYFGLFNAKQYSYKVVSVSDIINKIYCIMLRSLCRLTAGINNRYSSKEYVLASFMKGTKHAVIPTTSININPINTDKGEIKICGDTTPLIIVAKGSKAQMNLNKTKFARETVYNPSSTLNKRHHDFDSSLDGSDDDEDEAPPIVSKKRPDINDSSKMLNKLLSRKKAPAKKKKKTTTIIDDSTDVECKGCSILREELNKFQKRLERVERVIPAICLNTPGTTNTTPSLPKIEEINQNIK
ncbi:unnamed protein product, partial [Rotaria sp. Silwood2]